MKNILTGIIENKAKRNISLAILFIIAEFCFLISNFTALGRMILFVVAIVIFCVLIYISFFIEKVIIKKILIGIIIITTVLVLNVNMYNNLTKDYEIVLAELEEELDDLDSELWMLYWEAKTVLDTYEDDYEEGYYYYKAFGGIRSDMKNAAEELVKYGVEYDYQTSYPNYCYIITEENIQKYFDDYEKETKNIESRKKSLENKLKEINNKIK